MIKDFIKNLIKLSPIPLTKNHKYDLLTRKIIRRISRNSNCIDVGCYKGEILDLMLEAAPQGQHYGVEPIPMQFDALSMKYKNYSNCTLFNVAAAEQSGRSSFNYVASNPPYSGLKERDYDRSYEAATTIQVRTEPLDKLIPPDIPIHLIKIDVEGAEMLVLNGAKNLVKKYRPTIIFEHGMGASNHYGTTPEMIYDYFHQMDMKISLMENFLNRVQPLISEEFSRQYYKKLNYYFVAHP
ncbi:MAG: FkbM family methyltransferase [Saprospiraceae bacterium]|nr:FkbM family methyltransferase [Saprospiraceae bacterium]